MFQKGPNICPVHRLRANPAKIRTGDDLPGLGDNGTNVECRMPNARTNCQRSLQN